MLHFNSILLSSENPSELIAFYTKVFEEEPHWTGGGYSGFDVGGGGVIIGPHDKVHGKNQTPERLIINFETEDVKGEYTRILSLGAKEIAAPYHPMEEETMELATLADPDGNYFQLASPMK